MILLLKISLQVKTTKLSHILRILFIPRYNPEHKESLRHSAPISESERQKIHARNKRFTEAREYLDTLESFIKQSNGSKDNFNTLKSTQEDFPSLITTIKCLSYLKSVLNPKNSEPANELTNHTATPFALIELEDEVIFKLRYEGGNTLLHLLALCDFPIKSLMKKLHI